MIDSTTLQLMWLVTIDHIYSSRHGQKLLLWFNNITNTYLLLLAIHPFASGTSWVSPLSFLCLCHLSPSGYRKDDLGLPEIMKKTVHTMQNRNTTNITEPNLIEFASYKTRINYQKSYSNWLCWKIIMENGFSLYFVPPFLWLEVWL